MKFKKKKSGGGGDGEGGRGRGRVGVVRVDVIEELKFLGKFGWGGLRGSAGRVCGRGGGGQRVDVTEKLKFL